MGEVIAFGLPPLRVRHKPTDGFCEVTILPGRTVDARNAEALVVAPRRRNRPKTTGTVRTDVGERK